jgi:hypothetical protein
MQSKRIFPALLLLFAILSFSAFAHAQNDGPVTEIIVTSVDASEFPRIKVYIRALNAQGMPVDTALDLTVSEEGAERELVSGPSFREGSEGGPLWVHFVIDAGVRLADSESRWQMAKDGIAQFAQGMLPDDHVAISAIQDSETGSEIDPVMEFSKNPEDIITALESYQRPSCPGRLCFTEPISPLQEILADLAAEDAGNQPRMIVYFTSRLEDERGNAAALVEAANEQDIPIYIVFVDPQGVNQELKDLAVASGGDFHTYEDTESLAEFYDEAIMQKLRPYFELAYRTEDGQSSIRVVEVSLASDNSVSNEGEYARPSIQPPEVNILYPEEDDLPLDPTTANPEVIAQVNFPDELPRNLLSATLTINDEEIDSKDYNPPSNPVEIVFPLTWEDFAKSGEVELTVEVFDEIGETNSAAAKVQFLEVTDPTPGATEAPDASEAAVSTNAAPENGNATIPPSNTLADLLLPISIALLAVVMIAIVLTRDKGPVKAMRQTINQQVDRLTKRIVRQSARAYLIVLDGDASAGKSLELYGTTTIGRAKQDSELLFQQHDETSPISRRHCTIIDEEDHFLIRDEDSANGTYVNGVRLESMVPGKLEDGDEIELARVERGGVKLQFQEIQPAFNKGETVHWKRAQQTGEDRF